LPELSADNFIPGFGIAGYIDSSYVHTLKRIDDKSKSDFMFFFIDFRRCIDICESVTFIAEALGNFLGRSGNRFAGKNITFFNADKLTNLIMRKNCLRPCDLYS